MSGGLFNDTSTLKARGRFQFYTGGRSELELFPFYYWKHEGIWFDRRGLLFLVSLGLLSGQSKVAQIFQ
jgi:hypothetical protein